MDLLKKVFPVAFMAKNDIAALVISLIIQLAVAIIIGFVIGILVWIPIVGILFALIGSLIDLYVLANIVLTCLDYFQVLK